MSENEIKPIMLKKLIGQYWSIAFCEGSEGRTTDTSEGDAQRVWHEIESAIDRLKAERDAAVANAQRYQWLRGALANDDIRALEVLVSQQEPSTPEEFDAAIDAARAEGGV